jgi:hypothetical protein
MKKLSLLSLVMLCMSAVVACNGTIKASSPPAPAVALPGSVMDVAASAETTRDTGIVRWQLGTESDGTIRMLGFDLQNQIRFTGSTHKPDKDGTVEFRFLDGRLLVKSNGDVVSNTLSPKAIDLAGRLHSDTDQHVKATNVALSACSQATDYYNDCAIAASIAAAACVADPATCAALYIALNFEAQARSAMNEICGSDGCGDRCGAPFSCDASTGNCICVSSCSGLMCGQTDECGNGCPSWDIDPCGECGGDGTECTGGGGGDDGDDDPEP